MPLNNGNDDLPPGGINVYVNNYGGSKESWYTDNSSQTAYLNYVDLIVNRYKSSPAIFSWELCNEPRCEGCPTSDITNWATKVSAHIKTQDSKHLVALGDEGWFAPPEAAPSGVNTYPYTGGRGVDFTQNLNIPSIDYGTFHMYPELWGESDAWGNTYIQEHDQVGKTVGKPVVLEEYGSLGTPKTTIMSPYQATLLQSTIAGDHFWQFAETLSDDFNPGDGYDIQYDTTAGSDYDVLAIQHAQAMTAKAVGG